MKKRISGIAAASALSLFVVTLAGEEALAISRYNAASLSCAGIKAKVGAEGAINLRWTSSRTGNTLYQRVVKNSNYCDPHQIAKLTSVPSADQSSCVVYRCEKFVPLFNGFDRRVVR